MVQDPSRLGQIFPSNGSKLNGYLIWSTIELTKNLRFVFKMKVYREEVSDGRGWIESRKVEPIFSRNLSTLLTIRPIRDSSAGHFGQIVAVDISNNRSSVVASSNAVAVTHGKFEVVKIVDWDEESHLV